MPYRDEAGPTWLTLWGWLALTAAVLIAGGWIYGCCR